MVVVFVMRGLPGTGKTTLCRLIQGIGAHLKIAVVSRDHIRTALLAIRKEEEWVFSKENEDLVTEQFLKELNQAAKNPELDWVIVDNTTLSIERLEEVTKTFDKDAKIVILQLGNWLSHVRSRDDLPWTTEKRMRNELADSATELFSLALNRGNVWFYQAKSQSDQCLLTSGANSFDYRFRVALIGGWTKIGLEKLCLAFDPSLNRNTKRTCSDFHFRCYKDVADDLYDCK